MPRISWRCDPLTPSLTIGDAFRAFFDRAHRAPAMRLKPTTQVQQIQTADPVAQRWENKGDGCCNGPHDLTLRNGASVPGGRVVAGRKENKTPIWDVRNNQQTRQSFGACLKLTMWWNIHVRAPSTAIIGRRASQGEQPIGTSGIRVGQQRNRPYISNSNRGVVKGARIGDASPIYLRFGLVPKSARCERVRRPRFVG